MHSSLSCRGRVAYGTSLSKPPLPVQGQQGSAVLKQTEGLNLQAGVEGEDSRVCKKKKKKEGG